MKNKPKSTIFPLAWASTVTNTLNKCPSPVSPPLLLLLLLLLQRRERRGLGMMTEVEPLYEQRRGSVAMGGRISLYRHGRS